MKASEARKLSEKSQNTNVDDKLKPLFRVIEEAAKDGHVCVEVDAVRYFPSPSGPIIDELRRLDYQVVHKPEYRDGDYYVICWG